MAYPSLMGITYHVVYDGFQLHPAIRPCLQPVQAAAGRLTTCGLAASHTPVLQPTRSSRSNNHVAQRRQAARALAHSNVWTRSKGIRRLLRSLSD